MGKGSELFYDKPLHLVRGAGVWLFDPQGSAYLDVYNNVPHVGHAHPAVVRAVQSQAAILATHTRYLHSGILDYAERLLAKLPARLDACIFVNSGSEANDVAWRMAQFATGHAGALWSCATPITASPTPWLRSRPVSESRSSLTWSPIARRRRAGCKPMRRRAPRKSLQPGTTWMRRSAP